MQGCVRMDCRIARSASSRFDTSRTRICCQGQPSVHALACSKSLAAEQDMCCQNVRTAPTPTRHSPSSQSQRTPAEQGMHERPGRALSTDTHKTQTHLGSARSQGAGCVSLQQSCFGNSVEVEGLCPTPVKHRPSKRSQRTPAEQGEPAGPQTGGGSCRSPAPLQHPPPQLLRQLEPRKPRSGGPPAQHAGAVKTTFMVGIWDSAQTSKPKGWILHRLRLAVLLVTGIGGPVGGAVKPL